MFISKEIMNYFYKINSKCFINKILPFLFFVIGKEDLKLQLFWTVGNKTFIVINL